MSDDLPRVCCDSTFGNMHEPGCDFEPRPTNLSTTAGQSKCAFLGGYRPLVELFYSANPRRTHERPG